MEQTELVTKPSNIIKKIPETIIINNQSEQENLNKAAAENNAQENQQENSNKQTKQESEQNHHIPSKTNNVIDELFNLYPNLLFGKDDPMAIVFVANKVLIENFEKKLEIDREKYTQSIKNIINELDKKEKSLSKEIEDSINKSANDIKKAFDIETTSFSAFMQKNILERSADIINKAFEEAKENMHKAAFDKANSELNDIKNTIVELTKNEYQNISHASKKIKIAAWLNLTASVLTMATISIIIYLALFGK